MLEADLHRFYGESLVGAIDEGRVRQLWIWFNGLPPEAAVHRVDGQEWTLLHELLAINAEVVDQWGLFGARTRVKHPEKLPKEGLRFPRPGASTAQRDEVITDAAEIARWFS